MEAGLRRSRCITELSFAPFVTTFRHSSTVLERVEWSRKTAGKGRFFHPGAIAPHLACRQRPTLSSQQRDKCSSPAKINARCCVLGGRLLFKMTR